jgi:hypothetical protein
MLASAYRREQPHLLGESSRADSNAWIFLGGEVSIEYLLLTRENAPEGTLYFLQQWWRRWDSNPRLRPCKGRTLAN